MYLKRFKPNKFVKCLQDFQYEHRYFSFYKDSIYELQHDIEENKVYISSKDCFLIEFCLVEDKFTNLN